MTPSIVEPRSEWDRELDAVAARIAPRFARRDLRRRAGAYLRALAAVGRDGGGEGGRSSVRSLAAAAGEATPAGFRHLLDRARWDADAVRDDLRDYVVERLTVPGGGATLIAGEVRFPKRGLKSAGTTRRRSPASELMPDTCRCWRTASWNWRPWTRSATSRSGRF